MKFFLPVFLIAALLSLSACGGGSSGTTTPNPKTFTISGTVSGLTAAGLVLQNNGGNDTSVAANATSFTFSTPVNSGASYSVSVSTQPTGETCTVNNGTGTATDNVTGVQVTCTPSTTTTFAITASATGLTSGSLVLQDDAGQQVTLTSTAPSQTFSNQYASGASYMVRVVTVPTGLNCTPSGNTSGTITANLTITITCSPVATGFTLSASVTGLSTGSLIVQDDAGDQLQFNADGTQTFGHSYTSGATYTVSIATQPTGETCAPTSTTGTITTNTTVSFTCTLGTYTISAAVTGLTSGETLTLQDSQSDTLSFTGNNTQTFAKSFASGAAYSVTVATQPTGETCTLSGNSSGNITSNITVTVTCAPVTFTISATVTGLTSGTLKLKDDKNDQISFTTNNVAQTFASPYASGSPYSVSVATQPLNQTCTLSSNAQGTITADVTVTATCTASTSHPLGTVSGVSSITCKGSLSGGTCEQMTVSCPNVPDIDAYIKINTPSGTPKGTVLYGTGTGGNGLYESIFTFGGTAVGNVLNAGFRTVQISFGTPFNSAQPNGWPQGPGGVLATACRWSTLAQYVYTSVQNSTTIPMCATANSGGAGALAYALSQYGMGDVISMAEITSGPPTGRLDWGCGCTQGAMPVPNSCFPSGSMGTCFGTTDAGVWDPAYTPNAYCSQAVGGTLPPGGLDFFLQDSVEADGAQYSFPKTSVNLLFGGTDTSSAIAIGWDWYLKINSTKSNGCVADAPHSIANVSDGATQIANDIIGMCKLQ